MSHFIDHFYWFSKSFYWSFLLIFLVILFIILLIFCHFIDHFYWFYESFYWSLFLILCVILLIIFIDFLSHFIDHFYWFSKSFYWSFLLIFKAIILIIFIDFLSLLLIFKSFYWSFLLIFLVILLIIFTIFLGHQNPGPGYYYNINSQITFCLDSAHVAQSHTTVWDSIPDWVGIFYLSLGLQLGGMVRTLNMANPMAVFDKSNLKPGTGFHRHTSSLLIYNL